jgi:hypothetical protein
MVRNSFLDEIGQAFIFKRFRPGLRHYLMKAGIDRVPFKFFGLLFFGTMFFTIITYFVFVQSLLIGRPAHVIGIIAFGYIGCLLNLNSVF